MFMTKGLRKMLEDLKATVKAALESADRANNPKMCVNERTHYADNPGNAISKIIIEPPTRLERILGEQRKDINDLCHSVIECQKHIAKLEDRLNSYESATCDWVDTLQAMIRSECKALKDRVDSLEVAQEQERKRKEAQDQEVVEEDGEVEAPEPKTQANYVLSPGESITISSPELYSKIFVSTRIDKTQLPA